MDMSATFKCDKTKRNVNENKSSDVGGRSMISTIALFQKWRQPPTQQSVSPPDVDAKRI